MSALTAKIILGALMSLAVGMVCLVVYSAIEHHRDLEENGCREQVRAKTGKRILIGKIIHDEEVIVYECANGRRVEFQ